MLENKQQKSRKDNTIKEKKIEKETVYYNGKDKSRNEIISDNKKMIMKNRIKKL